MQSRFNPSRAVGRTKAKSRTWGGIQTRTPSSVALQEPELQQYAETKGIIKEAALAWVHSKSSRAAAVYKKSKQWCPQFKRELNPLFLTMQVAVLSQQGKDWTYQDLAKDMLELHDPGVVKVVHDLRVKQDSQLSDQLNPTLESVHTECINFYAAWFQQLHADYPQQDLLATAGRTDDVTRAAASSLPCPTAETLLSALGLQYSSQQPEQHASRICAIAASEACTVPALLKCISTTMATSHFGASLSADQRCALDQALKDGSEAAAATEALWRLLAITVRRDVYVLDMAHCRLCCYPGHDGNVDIAGTTDSSGRKSAWSMKAWSQPGFYYLLGKLPLPAHLSDQACTVIVASGDGTLQVTSQASAVAGQHTQTAIKALQDFGILFAQLDVKAAGQRLKPPAAEPPWLTAGKKACAQLLHKLMGDAASAISFQSQRLVPVSDHSPTSVPILVPIINPDDSSAEYTLTMKEAATLAYLWNVGLFPSKSARTTVFDLLFKSVRLEEASMHTQAMKDNLVSEILHAAKTGRWKPGYALTKTVMSSFHVKGRAAMAASALLSMQSPQSTYPAVQADAELWASPDSTQVTEHSEMRQLRHQNHHLKQQLEQHRESMGKMQDTMDVMAFQMNKMGTVNRGQLGCTMALLQQTAQGSKLGGGSTTQHVQASDTSSDKKLTAAARQRRKAEKRSQEMLMAAKQEVSLQDRQMQAAQPEGPSSGSGGAAGQSDLQAPSSPPAQQPSVSREDIDTLPEQAAEHSQAAKADGSDQGAGAGTSRLSNLPIDLYPASIKELKVPGRDEPVWTSWLGQYLTLNTYKQLQWLYADWVDGIRVKTADASSEQRVAPLRLLEHQFRTKTHVAPWRSGNKIAKAVAERKVLVYAILRRLPDPAALVPSTDSAVSDAIQEVEKLRMEHSKSSSLLLSNKQLHDLLTGTPAKNIKCLEEGATEFESGTLGWPQPASMTNGNPKQKD